MFNRFNRSFRLLLCLVSLVPLKSIAGEGVLLVEKPQIMQPPPGAQVAAGFMRLVNPGNEDIVLTGADSDTFDHVEIHESVVENDVAKMIKLSELVIPAGGSVELKHGSYHLMLMGIKNPLEPDQEVPLMLSSSAGMMHVVLKVMGPGHHSDSSSHSGHDMKGMSEEAMEHDAEKHKHTN